MQVAQKIFFIVLIGYLLAIPGMAFAEDTDTGTTTDPGTDSVTITRGIVDCNANFGNLGKQFPTVAYYVPVWDEAVSFNTYLLLYKECVLDVINNKLKQAFIASVVKDAVRSITGDGRNPQFVTNLEEHLEKRKQKKLEKILNEGEFNAVCSPFKDKIIEAVKKTYEDGQKPVACSMDETTAQACLEGDLTNCGGLEGFYMSTLNPNNNPIFAYFNAVLYTQQELAKEEQNERQILNWGQGFKPLRKEERITLDDGTTITREYMLTPGYLIAQYATDIMGTGLRQLETADELNEIIGALMQQIGTAAITGTGFTGLAISNAGGMSYLDLLTQEAGEGVRTGIIQQYYDQLTSILNSTLSYITAIQDYLKAINRAENILRSSELACLEGSGGVLYYAREALKKRACALWYGDSTSTTCSVTVSARYDQNAIETYESSLGYAQAVAYLEKSSRASFWFKAGAKQFGSSTVGSAVSLFGNYKFISKPAFAATSTIPNGDIKVYLKQGSLQTTRGEFKFSKKELGEEGFEKYMLVFGYDLPDIEFIAKHPTTTQTISMRLQLDKKNTQKYITNTQLTQYQTREKYYQLLSKLEKYFDQVRQAQQALASDPTQEDLDRAQQIIDSFANNDLQEAFNAIQFIKSNTDSIVPNATAETNAWKEDNNWCSSRTKDNLGNTLLLNIKTAFCLYLPAGEKSYYPECSGL